jgi:hypothetical protein
VCYDGIANDGIKKEKGGIIFSNMMIIPHFHENTLIRRLLRVTHKPIHGQGTVLVAYFSL